jgi:hypothetical protein
MAHSVDNYVSGNGIMSIYLRPTPFVEPTTPDWVDVGDCPQFSFTPKITKKDYWGHRTGVQARDKRIKVKEEGELKITLSEFTKENLRMYLGGLLSGTTVQIMEGGTEEYMIKFEQVLIAGEERILTFYRADFTAAGALEMINDGEGEGDWAKMEFAVQLLDDSVEHPSAKWGISEVAPTE